MQWIKEILRRVIWYFCEATFSEGQFIAAPGTLKFKFLNWLYGEGEPLNDGWEYPEE